MKASRKIQRRYERNQHGAFAATKWAERKGHIPEGARREPGTRNPKKLRNR